MKNTVIAIISALLLVANVNAESAANLKDLAKSITNSQAHNNNNKGSFVIVYGGQDISRGNFKVANTVDRTVLAG